MSVTEIALLEAKLRKAELEKEKLTLEKDLAAAKLRMYTIHNRVLWFSLTVVTVINLILAWGAVRHMRLWH